MPGAENPGALDAQGRIRDLSLIVPDVTPECMSPERLRARAAIDLHKMPLAQDTSRLGVPISGVRQSVAIGLNYRQHAEESDLAIPTEPVVFTKTLTSLSGANDDTVLPHGSEETVSSNGI